MSDKLSKINDLAFELQHDDKLTAEQYWKVKKIFELSVRFQLNENQQGMLQEVINQYDITKPKTVLHVLEHLSLIAFLLDEMDEVTEEDCIVVAQAFLDWAQEQGEE